MTLTEQQRREISQLEAALNFFPSPEGSDDKPQIQPLKSNDQNNQEANRIAGFRYGDSNIIIQHTNNKRYIKSDEKDRTRKLALLIWSEINLWDNRHPDGLPRQFVLAEEDKYTKKEIDAAINQVIKIPNFPKTAAFKKVKTIPAFRKKLNVTNLDIQKILKEDNLDQFNQFRLESELDFSSVKTALKEHIETNNLLPARIIGSLFENTRNQMIEHFFRPLLCDPQEPPKSRSRLANKIANNRLLVHELHRKESFLPLIESVMEAGDFSAAAKLARGFQHLKGMRSDSGIKTVIEKTLQAFENATTLGEKQGCVELLYSCYSQGYQQKNIGNWLFPLTARAPKQAADSFPGFNMLLFVIEEVARPREEIKIQVVDKSNPKSLKAKGYRNKDHLTHRLVYNKSGWTLEYLENGIVFRKETPPGLKEKTFDNIATATDGAESPLHKIRREIATAHTTAALSILNDKSNSGWRLEMLYKLIDSQKPQKHEKISRFLSAVKLSDQELEKAAKEIVKNETRVDTILDDGVNLEGNVKTRVREALLLAAVKEDKYQSFQRILNKFSQNLDKNKSKKYLKKVIEEKNGEMLRHLLDSGKLDKDAILDFAAEMNEWATLSLYSSFLEELIKHQENGVISILREKPENPSPLNDSKLALIDFMLGDEDAPENIDVLMEGKLAKWLEGLDVKDNKYLDKISEKARKRFAGSNDPTMQRAWLNLHTAAQKSSKRDHLLSRNAQDYLPNVLQSDSEAVKKLAADIRSENKNTRHLAFKLLNNHAKSGLRLDVLTTLIRYQGRDIKTGKKISHYLNHVHLNDSELEKATEFALKQDLEKQDAKKSRNQVFGKFWASVGLKTTSISHTTKKELIRNGLISSKLLKDQKLSRQESEKLLSEAISDNDKELVEKLLLLSDPNTIITVASRATESIIDSRAGFSSSLHELVNNEQYGAKKFLMKPQPRSITPDNAALWKHIIANDANFASQMATALLENTQQNKEIDDVLGEIATIALRNFNKRELTYAEWRLIFLNCLEKSSSKEKISRLLFSSAPFGGHNRLGFEMLIEFLKDPALNKQTFEIFGSRPNSYVRSLALNRLIMEKKHDQQVLLLLNEINPNKKELEAAIEQLSKNEQNASIDIAQAIFEKLGKEASGKIIDKPEIKKWLIENDALRNQIVQDLKNSTKAALLVTAIELKKETVIIQMISKFKGGFKLDNEQSKKCLRAALKTNDRTVMQTVMQHANKLDRTALLEVANDAISLTNFNTKAIAPLIYNDAVITQVKAAVSQNIDLARYIVKHGSGIVEKSTQDSLLQSIESYSARHPIKAKFSFFSACESSKNRAGAAVCDSNAPTNVENMDEEENPLLQIQEWQPPAPDEELEELLREEEEEQQQQVEEGYHPSL